VAIHVQNLKAYLKSPYRSVAIGVFDGVHLGHQQVLRQAGWALTFDPHPRQVLKPGAPLSFLTTLGERKQLMPRLLILKFTRRLAHYAPEEFVKKVLVETLGVKKIYVGYDFCFGKNRSGNIQTLIQLGRKYGFEIDVIPVIKVGRTEVRSSKIRALLWQGRVEQAAALLGRPYDLSGRVVRGRRLGRSLGFPTANLKIDPHKCLPAHGIYKTWAILGTKKYRALVSIGVRPTINTHAKKTVVEAYLLNFKRQIYGKKLRLVFIRRLRPERRFNSLKALVAAMHQDVRKAWPDSNA
jgi:riboflavin kinase/FMN adenylyltransferase